MHIYNLSVRTLFFISLAVCNAHTAFFNFVDMTTTEISILFGQWYEQPEINLQQMEQALHQKLQNLTQNHITGNMRKMVCR
jgi:hypothetical protein